LIPRSYSAVIPGENIPKGTRAWHTFPAWNQKSDQEEESMKSLAFLEQMAYDRKAAIYAAEHDGKMRHFAYHEGLGECREAFSQLLQDVQRGEIGVVMTPDAACLSMPSRRVLSLPPLSREVRTGSW
jgi:hypothetical protein